MINPHPITQNRGHGNHRTETWLLLTAVILAVALRFIHLGNLPLSDIEAGEALKAHAILGGSQVQGSQPLYTLLTAAFFSLFGSTVFLSRLIPALAGCLLVILPLTMRDELGRMPAIILAFGLAIDPALVSLSRQAGSVMPALFLTIAGVCCTWKKRSTLAGLFIGLAVLSGSAFWFGMIGVVLIILIDTLFLSNKRSDPGSPSQAPAGSRFSWLAAMDRNFWLVVLGTILLGGSLFMLLPSGLSAAASGLVEYVRGWFTGNGVSLRQLVVALFIYQTIPLLLGVCEGISGWIHGDASRRTVLIAFLIFTTLAIIYTSRQMGFAAWSIVCMWILAAWLLSRFSIGPRDVMLPILGHAALVIALIVFIILNITWVLGSFGGLDVGRSLAILGGVVVIIIISFLVAYGWGIDVAVRGVFIGVGLVVLVCMISFSVSAGGLNARSNPEPWQANMRIAGADLLLEDLDSFSQWNTVGDERLSIVVVNIQAPSLQWLLIPYDNTKYVNALGPVDSPAVIISDAVYQLGLSSGYSGETISWYKTVDWNSVDALGLLDWIFHRKVFETSTNLNVWIRQDLFITGSESIIQ
ncbi:MAG: hypothetical protein JXR32_00070 [Anaerolineaceae bacterium]|nr:hypothetical protein [Anaerolineaceae bacterium]